MKYHRLISKIALIIALLTLPMAWLLTTTTGLKATVAVVRIFSPVTFSYGEVRGKLLGQSIEVQDLVINYQGKTLHVRALLLDWQMRTLIASDVDGIQQLFTARGCG